MTTETKKVKLECWTRKRWTDYSCRVAASGMAERRPSWENQFPPPPFAPWSLPIAIAADDLEQRSVQADESLQKGRAKLVLVPPPQSQVGVDCFCCLTTKPWAANAFNRPGRGILPVASFSARRLSDHKSFPNRPDSGRFKKVAMSMGSGGYDFEPEV